MVPGTFDLPIDPPAIGDDGAAIMQDVMRAGGDYLLKARPVAYPFCVQRKYNLIEVPILRPIAQTVREDVS